LSSRQVAAPATVLTVCKLQMLDVVNAMAVAPPEEVRADGKSEAAMRPGSEASRKVWANAIRDTDGPAALSLLLLKYAKLLPPTAFKKGFRKWWLADGGLVSEEERKRNVEKELRKLTGDKGDKGDKKEEKVKESKELPPPQADSVHQVLLRLHQLDFGLAYS